jgi:hypothetical protein
MNWRFMIKIVGGDSFLRSLLNSFFDSVFWLLAVKSQNLQKASEKMFVLLLSSLTQKKTKNDVN